MNVCRDLVTLGAVGCVTLSQVHNVRTLRHKPTRPQRCTPADHAAQAIGVPSQEIDFSELTLTTTMPQLQGAQIENRSHCSMRPHFDRQVLADLLAEDTGCELRGIDLTCAVGVEAVEEGPCSIFFVGRRMFIFSEGVRELLEVDRSCRASSLFGGGACSKPSRLGAVPTY